MVEQRGGYHCVADLLAPLGEAPIGGHNHGSAFLAGVDQLENFHRRK